MCHVSLHVSRPTRSEATRAVSTRAVCITACVPFFPMAMTRAEKPHASIGNDAVFSRSSKTKQFCETSFQNGKLSAELTASCQCVWDFSSPPVESTAPATKKSSQVIRSAAPVTQNNLSKPQDLILQNATPLRKSAPWPPNICHEHVFCTAPATENASLQILFKCPMPAILFGHATKPSRFAHFWRGAQSLAPATRNDIWTSKSGPNP